MTSEIIINYEPDEINICFENFRWNFWQWL